MIKRAFFGFVGVLAVLGLAFDLVSPPSAGSAAAARGALGSGPGPAAESRPGRRSGLQGPARGPNPADPQADVAPAGDLLGRLPLSFEENRGQAGEPVRFLARGPGYALIFTPDEAVLMHPRPAAAIERTEAAGPLRLQVVGGNPSVRIVGESPLPGRVNYLLGADPVQWRTDVPTFARVVYSGIYPGIDLIYYGSERALEYDFVIAPGAEPTRIAVRFAGANRLELDASGDLLLHTAAEVVRQRAPVVYQDTPAGRRTIQGAYVLRDGGPDGPDVGFALGTYDTTRPLVIDPVLVYSTYLGGSGFETGRAVAVDAAGNTYVTGQTRSADFPTTAGVYAPAPNGGPGPTSVSSAYVAKLNPAGTGLVYATYVGGSGEDDGRAIAVDAAGNAHFAGVTGSSNFPTTPNAFKPQPSPSDNAFVAKLNAAGNGLVYSTYLGGAGSDLAQAFALDAAGAAYVAGITTSIDFTTPGALYPPAPSGANAFVAKLAPAGDALVYAAQLPVGCGNSGVGVAVDGAGRAHVTGRTCAAGFPVTPGAYQTQPGGSTDAFVARLNAAGSALEYSTLLGGAGSDAGTAVAVDGSGHAYVTGQTLSDNFPVTNGALKTVRGGSDGFVTKLSPTGTALVYSTFLGGSKWDQQELPTEAIYGNLAVDGAGHAYVTGQTRSPDFPVTADAAQPIYRGFSGSAFVSKVNPTGTALLYSTFLGGNDGNVGNGIALDAQGAIYVAGDTSSSDFPITLGAWQPAATGGGSAFVAKIGASPPGTTPATLTPVPAATLAPVQGGVIAWGRNESGQLGDGTTARRLGKVQVSGPSGVRAVAAGGAQSLALQDDGTIWAWGGSGAVPAGTATAGNQPQAPIEIPNPAGVTAIAAGEGRSFAVKGDGTLWTWGGPQSVSPAQVPGVAGVTAVAVAGSPTSGHVLALRNDGTVWTWGANGLGQLGDGTVTSRDSPAPVAGLSEVVAVAAGGTHSLAVKRDGTVWTWGANNAGQLGGASPSCPQSPETSCSPIPLQVSGIGGAVAAAAGSHHSLTLKADGTVWSWGANPEGQLGHGSLGGPDPSPAPVPGLGGVRAIAAGTEHSLALKEDGTVWGWGANLFNQLGTGNLGASQTVPVHLDIGGRVSAIAGGYFHSVAVVSAPALTPSATATSTPAPTHTRMATPTAPPPSNASPSPTITTAAGGAGDPAPGGANGGDSGDSGSGGGGGTPGGAAAASVAPAVTATAGPAAAPPLERLADGRLVLRVPGRAQPLLLETGTVPRLPDEWCQRDRVYRQHLRLEDVGLTGATFGVAGDGTLDWIPPEAAGCVDWARFDPALNLPAGVFLQFRLLRPRPGALLWVLDGDDAWRGRLYEVDAGGQVRYVTASHWAAQQAHFQEVWKNVLPVGRATIADLQVRGLVGPDLQ